MALRPFRVSKACLILILFLLFALKNIPTYGLEAPILVTIKPDGSIDPSSAPLTKEGDLYRFNSDIYGRMIIEKNGVIIDGANFALQGTGLESTHGLTLKDVENVSIKNLEVKNHGYGVSIINSAEINFYSCNVHTNNFNGLDLSQSRECKIYENTISENQHDIELDDDSTQNMIYRNTLSDGDYGIFIDFSSNNTIYNNNFLRNSENVYTLGSSNTWDLGYPTGGNFWDLLPTVDQLSGSAQDQPNPDGISDEPYNIDDTNTDHYPYVNQIEANKPPINEEKTNLEVYVVDENGAAIQGVEIDLGNQTTAITDLSGKAVFPSVNEGTYKISAEKMGYLTRQVTSSLSGGQATLTITMPSTGSLEFMVSDGKGAPIEGVKVSSVSQPSGQQQLTGYTGANGSLTFVNMLKGDYNWTLTKDDYRPDSITSQINGSQTLQVKLVKQNESSFTIPWLPIIAVVVGVTLYLIYNRQQDVRDKS